MEKGGGAYANSRTLCYWTPESDELPIRYVLLHCRGYYHDIIPLYKTIA
jgi:hypothetical protein